MVRRSVVPVAVIAAMLIQTGLGGAAEPILKLALQRADMPATLQKGPFPYPEIVDPNHLKPFLIRGLEAAHYVYQWTVGTLNTPIGSVDKQWVLEGNVYRAPDENSAKRFFALGKAAQIGTFSYDSFPGKPQNLDMPPYGDEQFGRVSNYSSTGLGVLVVVRKGAVIWEIRVATIPIQFQVAQAEMVKVLDTYAAKQKARVGA
jgi:hypothetical protein